MKNIKGKGNLFEEGGGGGLKEDLRYLNFMFINFMSVFSFCHICLRQRSTLSYRSIL